MPAEIAVRQLSGLATVLREDGHDFEEIVAELELPRMPLDDVFARIDWSDYARVLEGVAGRLGKSTLRRVGAAMLHTDDAYLFRANIQLGFDDAAAALASMCQPNGLFRTIVPCIDVSWEQRGPRHGVVHTTMADGYEPCRAHHELSAGLIAAFPGLLFEAPARVALGFTRSGVDYEVRFARPSPLAIVRRRWSRSHRNPAYLRAVANVFVELAERQANLQAESERLALSEEKLRRTEKMEALGQLTGGVAHDFNNLLLVIRGNLDLLHGRVVDESAEGLLGAAEEAVQRGAELTKQLLAFGRQAPLSPEAVDLNATVLEMEALLARTLGEQVQIETTLDPALWPATVDIGLLKNAILNLALNARDAMPEGGSLILATANSQRNGASSAGSEHDDYVALSLRDSGIGMSEAVQSRAFEPFFTTKAPGQGSGLGLAMVYGFMEQSGGLVEIDSESGSGTEVTLLLPRASAASLPRAAGDREAGEPGEGERVLVVEDDPHAGATVAQQLEDLGYRARLVQDAETALTLLEHGEPVDVLLTDLVLPGELRGTDLATRARRLRPALACVFMSGYADRAPLPDAAERLAKPFGRAELANALKRAQSCQPEEETEAAGAPDEIAVDAAARR